MKELPGKTIIETMIAFSIILISVGVLMHFTMSLQQSSKLRDYKIYNQVKSIAVDIKNGEELPDSIQEGYKIRVENEQMQESLYSLEIKAVDENDRVICIYKELYLNRFD